MAKKLDYHKSVDYSQADPQKILAQEEGMATAGNMPFGYKELLGTRGESAYVFDMGDQYGAFVQEGLGTKSLIAQAVYSATGNENVFKSVAQDTVACVINDLISVGATPVVLNAYWSSSSYAWLADQKTARAFIKGWREACDEASVVWGGGETQSLPGVIQDGVLEFAGSGFGVIKERQNLVQGKSLKAGDVIVLIESSGPHANGISLIREIASRLPDGYQTKLKSGLSFGEAALAPTILYNRLIGELQAKGIEIHYLSNITGHGWRKLMRAGAAFNYEINLIPPAHEIFDFIAENSGNDDQEMYGNFNMGAGFAIYVPTGQAQTVVDIAATQNLRAWIAGEVKAGPKQVFIKPKNILFPGETLDMRSPSPSASPSLAPDEDQTSEVR